MGRLLSRISLQNMRYTQNQNKTACFRFNTASTRNISVGWNWKVTRTPCLQGAGCTKLTLIWYILTVHGVRDFSELRHRDKDPKYWKFLKRGMGRKLFSKSFSPNPYHSLTYANSPRKKDMIFFSSRETLTWERPSLAATCCCVISR